MARPIRTYTGKSYFNDSIGIGVIPDRQLTVAGSISSTKEIAGETIVGNWRGNILSSGQVNVEGIDIKSTNQPKGLFLKKSTFALFSISMYLLYQ